MAVARYIDGGLFAGFESAATASIITEYPEETDYQAIINAQGRADLQAAEGKCVDQLLTGFAFHKLASNSTIPDPLDFPPVAAVLATDTLGWAAPDTPVYDYHADTDEIVPVAQDDALTRAWCAHGGTIQVVRDANQDKPVWLLPGTCERVVCPRDRNVSPALPAPANRSRDGPADPRGGCRATMSGCTWNSWRSGHMPPPRRNGCWSRRRRSARGRGQPGRGWTYAFWLTRVGGRNAAKGLVTTRVRAANR